MKISKLLLIISVICFPGLSYAVGTYNLYSSCTVKSVFTGIGASDTVGNIEFDCGSGSKYARIPVSNYAMIASIGGSPLTMYNSELNTSAAPSPDLARLIVGQSSGLATMNVAMVALNSGKKVGIQTLTTGTGCCVPMLSCPPPSGQYPCVYVAALRYCNNATTCIIQ